MKTVTQLLILTISALFALNANLIAQAQIIGTIADKSGKALPFSNILLLNAKDSSFVKGDIAKEDGSFAIQNVVMGRYLCQISMVGFTNKYSNVFLLTPQYLTQNLGKTVLTEVSELKTIEIKAKKPLFEQKIDRLVVNVENSITSAGSSALEVLERSPGVTVDRQNSTISLSGKTGVVVMINNRINYMTPEAAVQMLQGMSANNIERIEILATPPANLDAEGNAGYINIVLKKNQNNGLNGTTALTIGYGNGESGNGNLTFNYRKDRFNLFGSYTYLHRNTDNPMTFYRKVVVGGQAIETTTFTDRQPISNNHNARIGFEYQLTPKTVIGGLISSYDNLFKMNAANQTSIAVNSVTDTLLAIKNYETHPAKHIGGSLNLQHTLHKDEIISFDVDYLYYSDNNFIDYDIHWTDENNKPFFDETTRSGKTTPIKIAVGKIDYSKVFTPKLKMDAGIKAVVSGFDNDIRVEILKNTAWVSDGEYTANYNLDEKIMAAYTAFELKMDAKTSAKVGMRYEYTNSNLSAEGRPNIVDRQYGRFFPSLFLSHQINPKQSIAFSYSRRITRPKFNELAPFVLFVDPNTFFSGNPALQPAISNTVKADYKLNTVLFSLQYSHEDSTIARFQPKVARGTNKQYSASQNLEYQKNLTMTVGLPYSPTKWWTMYVNTSAMFVEVAIKNDGIVTTLKAPTFTLFSSQTFTLPKLFTFEVSGLYNSGSFWGATRNRAFGALNLGLQKKFDKSGSKLSLGYDNILNTMIFSSKLDYAAQNQYFTYHLQWDFPTVKLTFTKNFGNNKMKAGGKRASASEDEQKRVE